MKLIEPTPPGYDVRICEMPAGQVGVTKDGEVYYATRYSATCLTSPDKSYTDTKGEVDDIFVKLYSPGTVLRFAV